MTIPKKGSRKITVDGTEYRWNVRRRYNYLFYDYLHSVSVAVELLEKPGSTLHVTFSEKKYSEYLEVQSPITPKDVELNIKDALNRGWKPEISGGTFNYLS